MNNFNDDLRMMRNDRIYQIDVFHFHVLVDVLFEIVVKNMNSRTIIYLQFILNH